MKSVMLSIQPKWCEKILSGEKTIEVKKTRPKIETPFKCYIYCTKTYDSSFRHLGIDKEDYCIGHNCGKVISEFTCDEIEEYEFTWCDHEEIGISGHGGDCWFEIEEDTDIKSCMTFDEINAYGMEYGREQNLFGWHISGLKIYDEPRELSEFSLTKPPKSWGYVESEEV